MQVNKVKIRCSAIGKVMTNSRSKKDVLSQTAKTYLKELAIQSIYGFRRDIGSKYLYKGLEQEDEAIEVLGEFLNNPLLIKNEQRFENDFISGEPDVITPTAIYDTKCPWDVFNFPLFESECPNKDYYWQLQGYMLLTGKKFAKLAYVLVDTPNEYQYAESDSFDYSNLPISKRVKIFDIEYSEEAIEQIKERVIECRNYLSSLNI